MSDDLEPISVRDAKELYIKDITGDLSPNTVQSRDNCLDYFLRWCDGADNGGDSRITNCNDLTGRDFYRYKHWRGEDINTVTLRTVLSNLRQFMEFCVQIDAVPESLPNKIGVPTLDHGENERSGFMAAREARAILDHLSTYRYASRQHVLFLLAWRTGARTGGLHSLDVDDINWAHDRLTFRHRPDEDTRLKNGNDGERTVVLDEEALTVLRDYIDTNRRAVTDDHGRDPLFTSRHGRLHKRQLSKQFYYLTAPCHYGADCPSDKNPHDCEYESSMAACIECPHNTRPHDIRRGSITYWLKEDAPVRAVSDRMNVSEKTLDRHYDQRTETERAEQRREFFE